VFFIIENLYLRNSSYYLESRKIIQMNSKLQIEYTYKNHKLKSYIYINKNKLKKIHYTKHLSYCKKKQNKKALNYL
jgi:hypothetical protein